MKVPVDWSLTATLIRGLVWGSSANAADQENVYAPSPAPLTRRVYLIGKELISDAVDAELTIGVYNITTTTYTAKTSVMATGLASGGIVAGGPLDPAECVLELFDPANPTHVIVPCIQLITGVTARVTGSLMFSQVAMTADELGATLMIPVLNQQEEDATIQTEEDDSNQLEERQT